MTDNSCVESDSPEDYVQRLNNAVKAVADRLDADVVLFNAPISDNAADDIHVKLETSPSHHKNVFFILATNGGDAHAAYVIARDLQSRYKDGKVIICIAGDCYSAGTLIVLCAHELVIADRGRLGPLDVQLLMRDELGERVSGLTVGMTLEELQQKAFKTFSYFIQNLKATYGPQITLRTALDVAANITSGMFGEIYKQIDPIRMGQDVMALEIAGHYGRILGNMSQNLKSRAVDRLLKHYPSHECIIDREEAAKELFNSVRAPEPDEDMLLRELGRIATDAMRDAAIFRLDIQPGGDKDDAGDDNKGSNGATPSTRARGRGKDQGSTSGVNGGSSQDGSGRGG